MSPHPWIPTFFPIYVPLRVPRIPLKGPRAHIRGPTSHIRYCVAFTLGQSQVFPDEACFNAAMRACEEGEQWELALDLFLFTMDI